MIRGIGIDSVEIERCSTWKNYTATRLARIFSPNEITYCFEHTPSTIQRLAARFAVKEAAYKALCAAYPDVTIPFLTFCKFVELIHTQRAPDHFLQKVTGRPTLSVNWSRLQQHNAGIKPLVCHVSLTHTRTYATAVVILEEF